MCYTRTDAQKSEGKTRRGRSSLRREDCLKWDSERRGGDLEGVGSDWRIKAKFRGSW